VEIAHSQPEGMQGYFLDMQNTNIKGTQLTLVLPSYDFLALSGP
jgi:hypothetical protein